MRTLNTSIAALLLGACGAALAAAEAPSADTTPVAPQKAIFAGGCFWCTESDFEKVPGVLKAVSGYTGGTLQSPRYEDTHDGTSGHTEAVEVTFDPSKVTYAALVDYFWHHHDLLDGAGQFCDRGSQYRPAIFHLDDAQKATAEASRAETQKRFKEPIRTEITKAGTFWPAEDYHQDYASNNPLRYRYYRSSCGRDSRIEQIWGKPTKK